MRRKIAPEEIRTNLGMILKKGRIGKGLSQKELAEKVKIAAHYLSQVETGKRFPSYSLLTELAAALHTTPGKLMYEAEMPASDEKLSLLYSLVRLIEPADALKELEELIDHAVIRHKDSMSASLRAK